MVDWIGAHLFTEKLTKDDDKYLQKKINVQLMSTKFSSILQHDIYQSQLMEKMCFMVFLLSRFILVKISKCSSMKVDS